MIMRIYYKARSKLKTVWFNVRKLLHHLGIHWYMKRSSMLPGVEEIQRLQDWQKYSYRKCWLCSKEKPHSRYFLNIGVREKNAKL